MLVGIDAGGTRGDFQGRYGRSLGTIEVLPYASYLPQLPPIPWVDNDGSLTSKWFGTSFSKAIGCDPARASFLSSVLACAHLEM